MKDKDACFKYNEQAPRFNIWMWEIDDYNLSVGRGVGGGKRGSYIGSSFRLHTVGVNESGRKFVAASRKATRLYLCLCFAVGDLAPLVAAPGYIGDERHKHARSMPDLRALAFALAQRGLVLAASNSEDSESVRRASELGYWMWVEHAGLPWDELNRDGGEGVPPGAKARRGGPRGAQRFDRRDFHFQGGGGGGADFESARLQAFGK